MRGPPQAPQLAVESRELETLWNDLRRELPFSLFCAYPATSVSGPEYAQALHEVCDLHSSLVRFSTEADVAAEFAADRRSPGRARRLVVAALLQWGHERP